ncbi:hypothetical protein P8452_31948 [Trifolium repens]|nr:hypothetical protein P8452_31948 [Trifolium repens]
MEKNDDSKSSMEVYFSTVVRSRILFDGNPIGTIAAMDNSDEKLNYDQVFVRDFVPSALAFLMNKEHAIAGLLLLILDFGGLYYSARTQSLHETIPWLILMNFKRNALSYHMRNYFWLNLKQLNDVYRYKTEEHSHTTVNKFNVMPDSLPDWIFDFMPHHGGYFIGNVSPARMDFRWFCLGRCQIAKRALDIAETRLLKDNWPEYYDGKHGRFIGKQARKLQTWSIAGYLVARKMFDDPSHLSMVTFEEYKHLRPQHRRSKSLP